MKENSDPFLVLVADHSPIIRDRLGDMLRKLPGVDLVTEAATAADALCLIRNVRIDLVVLDVTLPVGGGMEVLRQMREEGFRMRVILLAEHPVVDYEPKAREYGVTAVLDKAQEILQVAELTRTIAIPGTRQF